MTHDAFRPYEVLSLLVMVAAMTYAATGRTEAQSADGDSGAEGRAFSSGIDNAISSAFTVLRRNGVSNIPPIAAVDRAPKGAGQLTAYRLRRTDGTYDSAIYLVTNSRVYEMAASGDPVGSVLLGSVIVHEMRHADYNVDEADCLQAEVTFLRTAANKAEIKDRIRILEEAGALLREAEKQKKSGSKGK